MSTRRTGTVPENDFDVRMAILAVPVGESRRVGPKALVRRTAKTFTVDDGWYDARTVRSLAKAARFVSRINRGVVEWYL